MKNFGPKSEIPSWRALGLGNVLRSVGFHEGSLPSDAGQGPCLRRVRSGELTWSPAVRPGQALKGTSCLASWRSFQTSGALICTPNSRASDYNDSHKMDPQFVETATSSRDLG